MSEAAFRIRFEREILKLNSSELANEITSAGTAREAAEIAVEMARRSGECGGSVIVSVERPGSKMNYLTLVEPQDSLDGVERDLQEKASRQTGSPGASLAWQL